MQTVTFEDLRALADRAATTGRCRSNLNLHPELSDPTQRFFNALTPGSYVRPHRHTTPPRWELFAVVLGSAVVLTFSQDGTVLTRVELAVTRAAAVEIPAGAWHTVAAVEAQTVLLEVKPGPYSPVTDKDFADWAPAEGEPGCGELETWFRAAQPGDRCPQAAPTTKARRL